MKRLALVAAALLAGCAPHPQPLPPVQIRTVTIDRPVPVACVTAADIPAEPAKIGAQLNGHAQHDLDLVAASAIELRSVLHVALVLLGGCKAP
jgi:hypothetical protein